MRNVNLMTTGNALRLRLRYWEGKEWCPAGSRTCGGSALSQAWDRWT